MAVKAILDIDINDAKMARFAQLADQYQATLAKTPNIWKAVGKEQASIATMFERMTASLMAQNQQAREQKADEDLRLNRLRTTDRLWTNMSRSSGSVLRNVLGIGSTIIKWGGILGGIAMGGSLLGLDKLGHNIADTRRTAMGLGMGIGQLQAFRVDFQRLVDPGGFLGAVSEMRANPALSWGLRAMGLNPAGDATQVSVQLLRALRTRAQALPETMLGVIPQMTGVPMDVESLRRLRNMKQPEFASLLTNFQRDVGRFNVNDRTGQAWQDFVTQLERAKIQIEDVFVNRLVKLVGPLGQLSDGIANAVGVFMGSKGFTELVRDASTWLGNLAKAVESGKFSDNVKMFADDVSTLVHGLHAIAVWMGKVAGDNPKATGAAIAAFAATPGPLPIKLAAGAGVGAAVDIWTNPKTMQPTNVPPMMRDLSPDIDKAFKDYPGPPQIQWSSVWGGISSAFREIAKAFNNNLMGTTFNPASPYGSSPMMQSQGPIQFIQVTINDQTGGGTTPTVNALAGGGP